MNKFALLPFSLLLFFSAKAQDRIVSINHDTLHCRIISVDNAGILYELKNNDGSVTGKFMPLSQMEEYDRSPQPEKIPEKHEMCLDLSIGGSSMPWYLDNYESYYGMPDYYDKLKTGYHINASAHYMIKRFLGLGAEYSFFNSGTSGSVQQSSYSMSVYSTVSEECRMYVNYLGASVLFQQHPDAQRKFILSESLSGGVVFIRMENQVTSPSYNSYSYTDIASNRLLTGTSFSGKFGLSAEYRLFQAVSLGLGGDFIWCTIKKASYESKGTNNYNSSKDKEKLENPMKMSRFDYSFVLRFYF
jgi:hypothetical protein